MKKFKYITISTFTFFALISSVYANSDNVLENIIENSYIPIVFLCMAALFFVVEIFTPGFGFGAVLSIIFLGLYFTRSVYYYPFYIKGQFIFILGLILIILEALIPGFGIAGISGILCLCFGIIFTSANVYLGILSLGLSLTLSICTAYIFIKRGNKSKLLRSLTLYNPLQSKEGYVGIENRNVNVGDKGVSLTVLKPSGYCRFKNDKIQVYSEGNFIEKDILVKVSRIEGYKIFVDEVKN